MKSHYTTFDPIYGFISITETEQKIISCPYYQRLRWIHQLGFSNYIFPGAEHNRFSHALGVMHMADKMLRSIGKAVPDHRLYDVKATDQSTIMHKSIRIAALLHDIGTFPFSHTCEAAYIKHGDSSFKKEKRGKPLPNTHEHLGAFILKRTNFTRGITKILHEDGVDPVEISKLVKGESNNMLANQLLHSELDADRFDYLMRDAYYTGLKYGHFDRDYILYNLTTFMAGKKECLAVHEQALHAVEDFLIARFAWYSQIVRTADGAKFDIIAAMVTKYLLENDKIYQFQDLLSMVETNVDKFYGFNDHYIMSTIHQLFISQKIKNPKILEMVEMLLYRKSPKIVQFTKFKEGLISRDDEGKKKRDLIIKQLERKIDEFQEIINEKGSGKEWILTDIPVKDITFAKSMDDIVGSGNVTNILQERDPVKILDRAGNPSLLVENENSLMRILSGVCNFIPSIYLNQSAYDLLEKQGVLVDVHVS